VLKEVIDTGQHLPADSARNGLSILDTVVDTIRTELLALNDRDLTTEPDHSYLSTVGLTFDQLLWSITSNLVAGIRANAERGGALAPLSARLDADIVIDQNEELIALVQEVLDVLHDGAWRIASQHVPELGTSSSQPTSESRVLFMTSLERTLAWITVPDLGVGVGARALSHDATFVPLRLDHIGSFGSRILQHGLTMEHLASGIDRMRGCTQVVAPLGAGKSSLLRHLALGATRRALADPDSADLATFPLIFTATHLQQCLQDSDDMATAVGAACHRYLNHRVPSALVASVVSAALGGGTGVLHIDGFDEHPGSAVQRYELWDTIVSSHSAGDLGAAIVVTTRPHAEVLDERFDRYRLAPPSAAEAFQLAIGYLGQTPTNGAGTNQIEQTARMIAECMLNSEGALLATPLHSMLLSWLFSARPDHDTGFLDDLRRPEHVYELYLSTILEWEQSKHALSIDRVATTVSLGLLASLHLFGSAVWAPLRASIPIAQAEEAAGFWERCGVVRRSDGGRRMEFVHRDLGLFCLARLLVSLQIPAAVTDWFEKSLQERRRADDILRIIEFQSYLEL